MQRNKIIDIIRGMAMLLVLLQHTMTVGTIDFSSNMLFQAVWTLQIPLFIVISGYVTRYSRPIVDLKSWGNYVARRSAAYLLPWIVWTFVVRGLIFGQDILFDLQYLLWHMDVGYWFLMTIWTIVMVYGFADLLSNKFTSKKSVNIVLHIIFVGIGFATLLGIGILAGLDFLCIKQTLYYLPFYLAGYLYGQIESSLNNHRYGNSLVCGCVVVALAIWMSIIFRFDFYAATGKWMIVLRFVASMLGCIGMIGIVQAYCSKQENDIVNCKRASMSVGLQALNWVGTHSLEVYLLHGFSLCLLQLPEMPAAADAAGIAIIILNFSLAVAVTVLYIKLIESSRLLNKILFWK